MLSTACKATDRAPLSLNKKTEFLHHLRHLLRESTYLPDPAARHFFHNHILWRFRQYRPRTTLPGSNGFTFGNVPFNPLAWNLRMTEDRVRTALKRCRKMESLLSRANSGDHDCILRVLCYTYGRVGKRRHQLLEPYINSDNPTDDEALRQLISQQQKPANERVPETSSAVRALAVSQKPRSSFLSQRDTIKQLKPNIPDLNSWGRPMPLRRVRNIKRRFHSGLLDEVLPPLPQEEWEKLRDLATGVLAPTPLIPKRRCRAKGYDDLGGATSSARPYDILPQGKEGRQLSRRVMRRLWGKVFVQCPLMDWSTEQKKWVVKWGSLRPKNPIESLACLQESEMVSLEPQGHDESATHTQNNVAD